MSLPTPNAVEARYLNDALAGDEAAFSALAGHYRAELQLHCYRMLGSPQDAEDLVQETFLRAWSKRESFQGRASFRAWLYKIAIHACLDALRRRPRRVMPPQVADASDPRHDPGPAADLPWLEPYPDRLLGDMADGGMEPETLLLSREATELAFLAAIQHLSPLQRAVLILRDVLEWSAKETAETLETTVAAVNSALQRAHAALAQHLGRRNRDRGSLSGISDREETLLHRMMDAWERADVHALAAVLSTDARLVMPPLRSWYDGREAITTFFAEHAFDRAFPDRVRVVATAANRQPALAVYLRQRGDTERKPFGLLVLGISGDAITEMALFQLPHLFALCGLPERL